MLKTPAISPAGEFRRVNAFGALDLRIVSAAPEGEMAVWETIVAPEAGPPLHIHYAEDETFYVLGGIFSITVGERSIVASPGATMFLPRGIPHTFRNIGGTVGRILCMATPGGFEEFFLEVERTGASDPAPPRSRRSPASTGWSSSSRRHWRRSRRTRMRSRADAQALSTAKTWREPASR